MEGDGLLAKYFGTQDPELYGGPVVGRSLPGFPIVGPYSLPHLTQREMEELQHFNVFHARWFRMWVQEDLETYLKVMDHVYNGEFFVKRRLDVPVPDFPKDEPGGSLKVWLEWVQVQAKPPRNGDPIHDMLKKLPDFDANIPYPSGA